VRRLLSTGLGALAMIASIATAVPARAGAIDVLPGESIHAAVKAAQPGDTIQLHPGVYEDVVVIKKDDITIQGAGSGEDGTILHPPATLPGRCFGGVAGICVLGDARSGVPVNGVTVTGVRAEGFVFGMVAVAAHLTSFQGNAAVDNDEYGIAAFESNSTTMADNVVSGSGEAGLYVGDSAHANLTMTGNETFGNRFGIFLRDSQNGDVVGNLVHDNCVGILNIDFPGSAGAGHYRIAENEIHDNSAFCPREGPDDPALSGVGVLIVNADRDLVEDNVISTNRASRPVPFHGGVVLVDLVGRAPSNNSITSNELIRNRPNVLSDVSGHGNDFSGNDCVPSC
jgi:parallel beta-helix repeat protein